MIVLTFAKSCPHTCDGPYKCSDFFTFVMLALSYVIVLTYAMLVLSFAMPVLTFAKAVLTCGCPYKCFSCSYMCYHACPYIFMLVHSFFPILVFTFSMLFLHLLCFS